MTREYFVFYTEASVVCILVFAMLLYHDLSNVNRSEQQIYFDHTLISFMLYFLSDAFWAGISSNQIPRTRLTVVLPNLLNILLMTLIGYEWFRFVSATERMPRRNERKIKALMRLPIQVISTVMLLTWIVVPGFWVSAEGELNEIYYPLLFFVPFIYVISGLILTFFQVRKEKNPVICKHYLLIGCFPILIALLGVFQLIMLNSPLFCLGCTLLMLHFFLHEMENQISIDSLTGLNNRGQLQRFVIQEENGRWSGASVFVMMIDANDFKRINDTYGHSEGDRALILISRTLKESISLFVPVPFLGRYGGDEFILILRTNKEEEIRELNRKIRKILAEKSRAEMLPYELTVSIGYARMDPPLDSFQKCMEQADVQLYREKASLKRGR